MANKGVFRRPLFFRTRGILGVFSEGCFPGEWADEGFPVWVFSDERADEGLPARLAFQRRYFWEHVLGI